MRYNMVGYKKEGQPVRLQISKSKNAESFYVVKSIRKDGRNTNEVVEKLGTVQEVAARANGEDPYQWARKYVEKLNEDEKENRRKILLELDEASVIPEGVRQRYNCGYLFLQSIYYQLRLNDICKAIKRKRKFDYDLNAILSRLVYCRIINPSSKLGTYEYSKSLLEQPEFDLHQVYRALDVIAEESDYIQERLYINSRKIIDRKTDVLYYDCTNYFFEMEEEKGLVQFGHCKEGRSLPIVQMGLFMDGGGIPLAFCINEGSQNEQISMGPVEKMIVEDFKLSKFVVCTDSGLSSATNKYFNSRDSRNFITATSLKVMGEQRSSRMMSPEGWKLAGGDGTLFNLDTIDEKAYYDSIFYKEEWFIDTCDVFNEYHGKNVKRDIEQRLVVTFSLKYRDYLRNLREARIARAQKLIARGENAIKRKGVNDVRQYISESSVTKDGELAEKKVFSLDRAAIDDDARYDGFYAIYTSLDQFEYPAERICEINARRWEIEECFKIMKSEFKARPVFLHKDNRIKSHFMTCFIALIVFRLLEHMLGQKYTYPKIIECLAEMDVCSVQYGYVPAYTRTAMTDDLHRVFGFRTDTQITSASGFKKIFAMTKAGTHCDIPGTD